MKPKLTGKYKEASVQIQKELNKEKLHPQSLKEAQKDLFQYLVQQQEQQAELEDIDILYKNILKDTLYRSKRTHILLWIAVPFFILFMFSAVTIAMNMIFHKTDTMNFLKAFVLTLYTSYILIEGIPEKYVLLFIFSGIPAAILTVMIERVCLFDFTKIHIFGFAGCCFIVFCIAYLSIQKEYKDWKKQN